MKKIISLIMVAALSLSLFAACGKKEAAETTEKTTKEPDKVFDYVSDGGHEIKYSYVVLEDETVKITKFSTEHNFNDEVVRMPDEIDGKKVTVIGTGAFKDVDKIIEFKVPSTLLKIEKGAFAGSTVIIADLANSKVLTDIGDDAFRGCEKLAKVELPDSLKTIGSGAFCETPALKYLTVRGDLSILDISQFEGANLLKIFTRETSTNVIKFAHDNKIPVYTINDNKEL